MNTNSKTHWTEMLPDPLPANPLRTAADWLAQAQRDAAQPNPNAMVLATVDGRGQPSARVVLCKAIDADAGYVAFYTNYLSRKGRELAENPHAALVFHWDHRHRQVRAEGRVERLSAAENDAYFESRPWQSRLGAWASQQSEPIESRSALVQAIAASARRFGIPFAGPGSAEPDAVTAEIARPSHWGGYRLIVNAMELWVEGEFRTHDRARWTRLPGPAASSPVAAPWTGAATSAAAAPAVQWSVTRLQP